MTMANSDNDTDVMNLVKILIVVHNTHGEEGSMNFLSTLTYDDRQSILDFFESLENSQQDMIHKLIP